MAVIAIHIPFGGPRKTLPAFMFGNGLTGLNLGRSATYMAGQQRDEEEEEVLQKKFKYAAAWSVNSRFHDHKLSIWVGWLN